ncbi:tetratricopeptide repeat protein [Undibacterium flavidum]|uniref:Tetratricopeptide repeat protein n=1 Tax=Undibacterium flavidum TaxID=2762297 RepID=A0ABR6Y8N3_9BURK|nr:tetratricopeptide repeat protein [Undibacterium flavidum]MBC3872946.1 tetratricopeptide repeat protein [Undibacterium flavidum]
MWSKLEINEALEKFSLASKADPKASGPWSHTAALYLFASTKTDPQYIEEYRDRARAAASRALELFVGDPLAQETLRSLAAPSTPGITPANREAMDSFNEAERLFQSRDFLAAINKYEKAFALDPTFAEAILYAGDCYFQLAKFDEAEIRYRKSIDINPRNFQAWRFLAHAQTKMGRPIEMVKLSLLKSIEIQPNYLPAWDQYSALTQISDRPLQALNAKRPVHLKVNNKDGAQNYTIEIDPKIDAKGGDVDSAIWLQYGISKANFLAAKKSGDANVKSMSKVTSPFDTERLSWKSIFYEEHENAKLRDPLLQQLRQFVKDGQIEAAIFIFFFDESYRTEFESWKKMHPLGIQQFIEKYALRPSPLHQ